MERILYEVKRVVVGQDHFLERVLVAHAGAGPPAGRRRARAGQDADRQDAGAHRCAAASSASSSRPTWCRPTWSARASTTRRPASSAPRSGPVFTNLLLADEINRAPAKVQSALLEVMQERQVTIAGETHKVPEPFLVMATQNPIETEGTYPLPEAQVDRFMMKVLVDYPSEDEEFVIVERVTGAPVDGDARWPRTEQLAALQRECRAGLRRPVADPVRGASWSARRARPARHGLTDLAQVHHLRRQPARHHRPDRGRARAGLPARPQLRAARGHDRPRAPTCCATAWCCRYEALAEGLDGRRAGRARSWQERCRRPTSRCSTDANAAGAANG